MKSDIVLKYLSEIESIISKIDSRLESLYDNTCLLMNYYYMCSNFKYLMGIKHVDFLYLYKNILVNRELINLDFFNKSILNCVIENVKVRPLFLDKLCDFNAPKIYCSYHLGSYRLMLFYMFKKYFDKLAIVLDDNSYNKVPKLEKIASDAGLNKITFINSEKSDSIFKIIRFINQGGSLFFFIDGNNGINNLRFKEKSMLTINLLGHPVLSRRGIAEISYLTNTPICPLYTIKNKFNPIENIIYICNTIMPNRNNDRDQELLNITQKIYNILSHQLLINADQWEGWLYYQYFIEPNNDIRKENVYVDNISINDVFFDKERFGLIKSNDKCYVYDTENRILYRLSKFEYDILLSKTKNKMDIKVDQSSFMRLLKFKILVKNDINNRSK